MSIRSGRFFRALVPLLILCLLGVPAVYAQPAALYFPATGHLLTDDQGFLSFWQAHDGARLLGLPVSEAQQADSGAFQYFERGRLEVPPGKSEVRTGAVAAEYAEALWRSFDPAPPHTPVIGEQVFKSTGHTLREPFLGFWKAAGGLDFFGPPISEPLWEQTTNGRRLVQYFERARLERDAALADSPDEIQVGELGRALALLRDIDIAPVPNPGAEIAGPVAPAPRPVPLPLQRAKPPAEPAPQRTPVNNAQPRPGAGKSIVVDLSRQWLYAYEGDRQVFDAPVSTGRDGMNTPPGTFAVYAKLRVQTMDGVTDGVPWVVPNVPHVMYIYGGVALHGTYWHNRFGSGARLSHGCVNLPLDSAAWLYDWAPVGTLVRVTN